MVVEFIISKIKAEEKTYYNDFWKLSIYFFRSMHIFVLGYLFLQASSNLDNFRSMGIMMFFAFFTANEALYRATSKVLLLFITFFILAQYFFSLTYINYSNDKILMQSCKWFNMYTKRPTWADNGKITSVYFRHTPYVYDWAILMMMAALNVVNNLYTNPKYEQEGRGQEVLENISYNHFRVEYTWQLYYFIRVKNYIF